MVVDAFLANDEWDLVLFRLKYLSPVVGKFYIGESRITFAGNPKDMVFHSKTEDLKERGYDVEVVELNVPDDFVGLTERWAIETFVRNLLLETVGQKHPNDIVLFSDVDEIPSLDQVKMLLAVKNFGEIVSIPTQVCLRRANWVEFSADRWRGKWGNALPGSRRVPRIRRGRYPLAQGEPGAHLSYVGMAAGEIRRKYQAFSHAELDRDDLSSESFLAFADDFHISQLGRALEPGGGLLRVLNPSEFNDVQRAAFLSNPEWFSSEPIRYPNHRRLVASWILFSAVRGKLKGSVSDAHAPLWSWRWGKHALAYGCVWLAWRAFAALGMSGVVKKIGAKA